MVILGVEMMLENYLGSTHKSPNYYFLCFISFWLNLGSFFTFWGFNGLFLGLGKAQGLFWDLLIKLKNCYFLCFL